MFRILLITRDPGRYRATQQGLSRAGFTLSFKANEINLVEEIIGQQIDLLLLDIENPQSLPKESTLWECLREIKLERRLNVIILVPHNLLSLVDTRPEINDFISKPFEYIELETRVKRSLNLSRNPAGAEIIKSGDLIIDQGKCEVYVAGKTVELTFKEYELLKFLASNKSHVFTREKLLDEVWGMDYFGGDRTVDVHIRRLRSKIEDAEHTFIDTVRNIGYKFRNGV